MALLFPCSHGTEALRSPIGLVARVDIPSLAANGCCRRAQPLKLSLLQSGRRSMAQGQQVKNYFKAPEGRYLLHSERVSGCSFVPTRPVQLTFATIQHQGSTHNYVIYNILDTLAFCYYASIEKAPTRQIFVGNGAPGQVVYPTCHDQHPSPDNMDLVVGLNTGDVVVGSVKAQLQASGSNTKLLSLLHFNPEGAVDTTRAVGVAWIPGTNASLFAAAHQSGNIYLYQPQAASIGSESSPRSGKAPATPVARPSLTISVSQRGLTGMAVSPDGTKVAATTKDGVLHIHDLNTGALICGFKSHYGGLTCCAWSHDSHYVATGGQDDLVCVFGLIEQAVVFWGEGHTSWITQVSFDRWESEQGASSSEPASQGSVAANGTTSGPEQTRYRIASVAQDCQLLLWDFVVEEEDYLDTMDTSQSRLQSTSEPPAGVHKRTPSSSNANANGGHVHNSSTGGSGEHAARAARETNLLPLQLNPPVKRSEMLFTTPVMAQMIHSEPCSDVLFMKEAVYTACYCGQIRCWRRPEKLADSRQQSSPTTSNSASRSGRGTTGEG